MATYTLTIDQQNNTATSTHAGEKLILYHGDVLEVDKGSGWTGSDGVSQIRFYKDKSDYNNPAATPVVTWTRATTSIYNVDGNGNSTSTMAFSVTTRTTNNVVTKVILTDEEPATSQIDWWYVVTLGGKNLDPEVVNKGGQATGADPTGWQTSSGN